MQENTPEGKTLFVNQLREGETISAPFLIKFSAVTVGKNGKPYMNLILMDRSGEVEARIWSDVKRYAGEAVMDAFVHVQGRCQVYQGRKQVVIKELHLLREDQIEANDYIKKSHQNSEELYSKLKSFVDSVEDPHYRALAQAVLVEDEEVVERLMVAPAAKNVHHAYRGGLLEHMVSVTQLLDSLASHYGDQLDRSLLLVGGFFHDIGKLWELSYERVTDYTDEGRLIGHHVIAVELISRKLEKIENFPIEKALLIKHVVLAHHGKLEYGSPKRPKCLEALVVHYIDDLDSKVNAIQSFMDQDQTPGLWTGFHRQHERYFFRTHLLNSENSQGQS